MESSTGQEKVWLQLRSPYCVSHRPSQLGGCASRALVHTVGEVCRSFCCWVHVEWPVVPTVPQKVSYPVLLCQWIVPKKKSISNNTCECLKGRETTVKARWQGGQCSEAVRTGWSWAEPSPWETEWIEGRLAAPCMMSSFSIDTVPQPS